MGTSLNDFPTVHIMYLSFQMEIDIHPPSPFHAQSLYVSAKLPVSEKNFTSPLSCLNAIFQIAFLMIPRPLTFFPISASESSHPTPNPPQFPPLPPPEPLFKGIVDLDASCCELPPRSHIPERSHPIPPSKKAHTPCLARLSLFLKTRKINRPALEVPSSNDCRVNSARQLLKYKKKASGVSHTKAV